MHGIAFSKAHDKVLYWVKMSRAPFAVRKRTHGKGGVVRILPFVVRPRRTAKSAILVVRIPDLIGNCFPNVEILSFGENQLTGPVPASIGNFTSLQILVLAKNKLTGHMPRELGFLPNLEQLSLQQNMLEANDTVGWEFISSLANCSRLQGLTISNNIGFSGQLPDSIMNLSTTVQSLKLAGNWDRRKHSLGHWESL
jgi:hypothetical protein